MRVEYPNGSYEVWSEQPKVCLAIVAPNSFGSKWTMKTNRGIHNQSTGNPDGYGIHRRGRKWYPTWTVGVGWGWK